MKKTNFLVFSLGVLLSASCLAGCGDKTPSPSTEPDKNYTVSFYVDETLYGETQTVVSGSKISKPADPVKEADSEFTYSFDGWYLSGSLTPWDFAADTITRNIELYANFEATPIPNDLSVWVWGGEDGKYISSAEFERLQDCIEAALPGKAISMRYDTESTNDGFNASVLNAKNTPDLVVSGANMTKGDAPLTLKEEQGRTKMGLGWFSNDTRYTGILDSCSSHLTDAVLVYNLLTDKGPDYFEFEAKELTLKTNEEKALAPTLKDGETRTVSYTSDNPDVVTVDDNGLVKAISEGSAVISANLGLVTTNITVSVISASYDLIVYVYGGTSKTTYITEDESTFVKSEFLKVSGLTESTVYWNYISGVGNDDFNATVNAAIASDVIIDVVVSGNKVDNGDTDSVVLDETYGKTPVGAGWFENTSRKVAVTEACDANMANAIKLHDLLSNASPSFEGVVLDQTEASVEMGQLLTLKATAYGDVAWTTSDAAVATVDAGVVTPVAVGTATITATAKDGGTATCAITVTAAPEVKPLLVVYVYGGTSKTTYITAEESDALKAAFLAASGMEETTVKWEYLAAIGNADFNAEVNKANNVDIVISGNNLDKEGDNPIAVDATNGKVAVGAGWFTNTSRKVAITDVCEDNMANAIALYELVSNTSPSFEGVVLDQTEAAIELGETLTLEATAYGDVTWTTSDAAVATVENGVVTPVAAGSVTITATAKDGGTATCTITVTAAPETAPLLVVYVYGGTSKTTYITAEESDALKAAFLAASGMEETTIKWEYLTGITNDEFNATVNTAANVDVVISGNKVDNGSTDSVVLDATNGKVAVGDGWFANTSRKVGVTDACETNMDNAVALYNLVKEMNPAYVGLDSKTASLELGATLTLTATSASDVTWTTSDATIATVENGVVTPIAAGSVTITATNANGGTATCEITVTAAPEVEPLLVVYVYGGTASKTYITAEESDALKAAFLATSGMDEATVKWEYITGVGNADFNLTVNTAANVDVVISGNNLDKEGDNPIAVDATNGKVAVGAGWFANTSRKVAITDACDANMSNAVALYTLVSADKAA